MDVSGGSPQSGRTAAWKRTGGGASAAVKAKSRLLESYLRLCAPRDHEMMMRFFLYGQSMEGILAELGATEAEFLAVKDRFRRRVEPKPARQDLPMVRQAAAG